jgi:predicted GNAT family N-acyltransferase
MSVEHVSHTGVVNNGPLMAELRAIESQAFQSSEDFSDVLAKYSTILLSFAWIRGRKQVIGYIIANVDSYTINRSESYIGVHVGRVHVQPNYYGTNTGQQLVDKMLTHLISIQKESGKPGFIWWITWTPIIHHMTSKLFGQGMQPRDGIDGLMDSKHLAFIDAIHQRYPHVKADEKYPFVFRNFLKPTEKEMRRIKNIIDKLPKTHMFRRINLDPENGDVMCCIVADFQKHVRSKL